MTVAITYNGNDDLVLAQVCADAVIVYDADTSTQNAIEAAYIAADVAQDYYGSDLNEIEHLALIAGAVPIHFAAIGSSSFFGNVLTLIGDGGGVGCDSAITGKKAIATKVTFTPPIGAEVAAGFIKADASARACVFVNGNDGITPIVICGLAGGTAIHLVWSHTDGDIYTVWRDDATGEWGVILPDGTDSGDLTATAGAFTGAAGAIWTNSFGETGTVEVIETGVTLPAGYSLQVFA